MLDETIFRGTSVAVVGSVCRDVRTAPLQPGTHLLEDGETPADFIVETLGGGGANSAVAAAHLGAAVRFAGKVGADPLGRRLEEALRSSGVRTFVRHASEVRTGSSVALVYRSGSRHFVSAQPNNESLALADLDLQVLDGVQHLLRADVWFSQPMLDSGNAPLLQAARQRGVATSLDINWDPLWGAADTARLYRRVEAVRSLLPLVDLVHGNARELMRFAGAADLPGALRALEGWGAGAAVVHLGEQGAGYYTGGRLVVESCAPVRQLLHTTGTGDLLSVCVLLLHARPEVPALDKLRLANRIVAEYMEGRRPLVPLL